MKNNKKILMITIISLMLVFTGITYAYFTAFNSEGSTAEISFGPGKMLIEYADKSDALSLTKTNIQPSDTILIDKTFTLTGTNTATADGGVTMPFTVSLEYQNTFQNFELVYFLKRTDENENIVVNIIDMDEMGPLTEEFINNIPFFDLDDTFIGSYFGAISHWSNETYAQEIASGYFKPSSEKQIVTFNLKMMFPDFGNNQDYNKGAMFNGKIVVNSSKAELPPVTGEIDKYLVNFDKSNNGLEIDNTSDKNLRYTGESPKNYVVFNDEIWRIIGDFNVYNVETNRNELLTKIIREESLGSYSWEITSVWNKQSSQGINDWNMADLMFELNCDGSGDAKYCRDDITEGYLSNKTSGTTTWHSSYNNTDNNSYDYKNNIKVSNIDKIANVRWHLGITSYASRYSVKAIYNEERENEYSNDSLNEETRTYYWDGKIGLMYLSDYGYGSADAANISCSENSFSNCYRSNNWLSNDDVQWTLSPYASVSVGIIIPKNVDRTENMPYGINSVRPSLFLKSNIKITGGTGTSDDPYTLS